MSGNAYKDEKTANYGRSTGSRQGHGLSRGPNRPSHQIYRGIGGAFEEKQQRHAFEAGSAFNGRQSPEAYELFTKKERQTF